MEENRKLKLSIYADLTNMKMNIETLDFRKCKRKFDFQRMGGNLRFRT